MWSRDQNGLRRKRAHTHTHSLSLSPSRPHTMGKKAAKKDRGYQTASEWAAEGGGFKRDAAGRPLNAGGPPPSHKTLPFTHCALTCEPFEDPVRVLERSGFGRAGRAGERAASRRSRSSLARSLNLPPLLSSLRSARPTAPSSTWPPPSPTSGTRASTPSPARPAPWPTWSASSSSAEAAERARPPTLIPAPSWGPPSRRPRTSWPSAPQGGPTHGRRWRR